MKLLIKFPTRERPQKSLDTLRKYIDLAESIDNIQIIVSIDNNDKSLNADMFKIHNCVSVVSGPSCGKIGAINRDMPDPSTFDTLLLASDDMIPIVKGYDNIIRSNMKEHFPDTDGVLFFNDGSVGFKLNTLVVCGSKYYSRFGYIYHPEYKSLFCDNEFMDEANRLGRQIYINSIIIKHEHPATDSNIVYDSLYQLNQSYWEKDKNTYNTRKFRNYDISILICTMPSRVNMFVDLINYINKLKQKSSLNVEVLHDDDMTVTIGEKRQRLLDKCLGKYCCFVDDDDKITENYLKVIEDSELKYDCIALNGMMYIDGKPHKPFFHSIKYDKWTDGDKEYYRTPNHLNPIRTDISKRVGFIKLNYHEDLNFSNELKKLNLIKTEYMHNKLQYLYMFSTRNNSKATSQSYLNIQGKNFINKLFNK